FYLLITYFCFSQSIAQVDLIDQWLRVDDKIQNPTDPDIPVQDSTIIDVKKVNGVLKGILIHLPEAAIDYGYSVGQVKWGQFKKIAKNTWELQGLLMESGVAVYLRTFIQL